MVNKVISVEQLPHDIRKQIRGFDATKRRRFMRKCIGPVMQTQVIVRFLRGGYIKKGDWKSVAQGEHIYNDRWSVRYWKRPSGRFIMPSSIRMVDGGSLGNSYRVLGADADSVTVGPGKTAHKGAGPLIAERAENEGNPITGFTQETLEAIDAEVQNYLDLVANGLEPPYLPKSRLGRRGGAWGMRMPAPAGG